jgi:hypothetical protein
MVVELVVSARQEGNEAGEATRQHSVGDNTPNSRKEIRRSSKEYQGSKHVCSHFGSGQEMIMMPRQTVGELIVSARQEGNEASEATRQHLAGDNTPKSRIGVTKVPANFYHAISLDIDIIRYPLNFNLPPSPL